MSLTRGGAPTNLVRPIQLGLAGSARTQHHGQHRDQLHNPPDGVDTINIPRTLGTLLGHREFTIKEHRTQGSVFSIHGSVVLILFRNSSQ